MQCYQKISNDACSNQKYKKVHQPVGPKVFNDAKSVVTLCQNNIRKGRETRWQPRTAAAMRMQGRGVEHMKGPEQRQPAPVAEGKQSRDYSQPKMLLPRPLLRARGSAPRCISL